MAFKKEIFVTPSKGEHQDEYIPRCIAKLVGDEGYENDQAAAICYSTWRQEHAKNEVYVEEDYAFDIEPNPCWEGYEPYGLKEGGVPNCVPVKESKQEFAKISIDYDDTLSTGAGLNLAKNLKRQGHTLYIISARSKPSKGMLARATELGIPSDRIFTTGSNQSKIDKVKELGISRHIDNNADVISALGTKGQKFSFAAETYTDYPEGAVNNAKRALAWAEKNGWGEWVQVKPEQTNWQTENLYQKKQLLACLHSKDTARILILHILKDVAS
jgi:hypothetical protein